MVNIHYQHNSGKAEYDHIHFIHNIILKCFILKSK